MRRAKITSKKEEGYIAIASMLVIAVIVFTIGTSVSLFSVDDIQSALAGKKSEEALFIVEGCVEDALLQLSENNSINDTITIPEGSCTVVVDSQSGNDWTFTVNTSFEGYTKDIQVAANRSSSVSITSWIEL